MYEILDSIDIYSYNVAIPGSGGESGTSPDA